MTRLPDKRVPLASRLHFSKDTIEQFKKYRFHIVLIRGNTRKEFYLAIESECMTHILEFPGILEILFIGRYDIRGGRIRPKGLKNRACFTECFGSGAINHHNETQHTL